MSTKTTPSAAFMLDLEGAHMLRSRLVLATLSGRAVRIRRIRALDQEPGLREAEASLIRLLDKITDGSRVEVSETGTALFFSPGLLIGGRVEHECSTQRGIGYFLEALICLAPFCKHPIEATLKGVTNDGSGQDPSPEMIKTSTLPVLKRFILNDEGLELKIVHRGASPAGGGQIFFRCPTRKNLRPLQFLDQGKVKRVRGVAWAARVSPAVPNRMVEAAKGVLLQFLPDVYIYTDHRTGVASGKGPGFGLTLTAETTTGAFLSAEVATSGVSPEVPEDLGDQGAKLLLEEIYRGGCVDSRNQSLALLLMCLGPRDVMKMVTGPLSDHTVHFLRHLRDFFGVTFKLESFKDEDDGEEEEQLRMGAQKVTLTCVGVGFTNLSKRTT